MNPKEKEIVAFHESGHALVTSLKHADPVHKITIISRGIAALVIPAAAHRGPIPDDTPRTAGSLAVLLGGRVAKLVFGEVSTGAQE